jgi:hypothetical protein
MGQAMSNSKQGPQRHCGRIRYNQVGWIICQGFRKIKKWTPQTQEMIRKDSYPQPVRAFLIGVFLD